jgi:hypothetical protein
MSKGVLYIATDESYVDEAVTSAEKLKDINQIPVSLIATEGAISGRSINSVDNIIKIDDCYDNVDVKPYTMHLSPYEKTLYLDCDAVVIDDVTPAFELLERYDIAAVHNEYKIPVTLPDVPSAFPEYNTGVIAFRWNERIREFFSHWKDSTENQIQRGRPNSDFIFPLKGESLEEATRFGRSYDQPTFREAIYESDVVHATLPSEYNFGRGKRYAHHRVKILHPSYTGLESKINESISPRFVMNGTIHFYKGNQENIKFGDDGLPIIDRLIEHLPMKTGLKYVGLYNQAQQVYKKINYIYNNRN